MTRADDDTTRGSIKDLARLLPWVRPYTASMVVMFSAALIGTLAGLAIPALTRNVIDGPIAQGDRAGLWWLGLLALAFGAVEAFLIYLRRLLVSRASLSIEATLRGDLYAHLQRLPVSFHDRWQSGQLLSRASTDLSVIRRFISFGLIFLVVNGLTFAVVVVLLIIAYWPLGVLVLISAIPLIVMLFRFEKQYSVISRAQQDQLGELTTIIEEGAAGIRILKAFGRARMAYARYDDGAQKLFGIELRRVNVLANIWAAIEMHPQIVLSIIVLGGSVAVAQGAMTLGTLVAFSALFLLLLWPIASLGFLLAMAQEAATATHRIFEVLDTPSDITSPEPPLDPPLAGKASLEFRDVGFRFADSDEFIVRHLNLRIEPGETVALVGATGTGKTTVTAFVPRLYDVTEGAVLLDGVDIRSLSLRRLRTDVAMAFEDPTLFSASVRENLTLGRPDATDEQIAEAIDIAQAGFVYDLPWGLDTRVGEQGVSLSGGQRQRLALARAVLGRPRVLVLDDPLSALDIHTEGLVEQALRRVLADTTGLVVAHRPSTVLLADRVAFLQGGTIAAIGTHSQLLAEVPAYRDILSSDADESSDLEEVSR